MTQEQEAAREPAPAPRPDVTRLCAGGKEVVLVGTAHVSRRSADLVAEVIAAEQPDTVCVELCEGRLQTLRQGEAWRDMDIVKVIREKKAHLLLSHLLLASFQKRIANRLGIQPGQEMIRAMEEADKISAPVCPVDREIRTTLSRAWRLMGFGAKFRLLYQMLDSIGEADTITEKDVEDLKEKDVLELVIQELGRTLPELRGVLIDERDRYMACKIRETEGKKIVAVVGAGHVPGICRNWEEPVDLAALEALPPKGKLGSILKWGIPGLVVLLVVAGFFYGGAKAGGNMVAWWVAITAACAGLGALAALAHPLSILAGAASAPLTTLHPALAAGWVSGLVEAFARKPRVRDMESLSTDIVSFRGFWKNKVTRILLVAVFTNLGAMIGTFVAIPMMARIIQGMH